MQQLLTIRELYNFGISEVLAYRRAFRKVATNNEKLYATNFVLLLIFLIFFQSNPPSRIQLPVSAENLILKGNCLKDGKSVSFSTFSKRIFFDLKNLLYCIKYSSSWYQLSISFRDKLQFSSTCLNCSGLFVTLFVSLCSFDDRSYNYLMFFFLCQNRLRIFVIKSYFKFLFYYFNPVTVGLRIVLRHVTKGNQLKFITISGFLGIAKG